MPPKAISATAPKSQSLLNIIRQSQTAFTLKELEKSATGPTGINGMQLKDYIQALIDENLIRVEKIGSGNWYWSFTGSDRKSREDTLESLNKEKLALETRIASLREEVVARQDSDSDMQERQAWQDKHSSFEQEIAGLRIELKSYEGADPTVVQESTRQTQVAKERTERWTDNILLLESWFLELTAGDRGALEDVRTAVYGEEYVEGEGLKELE